MDSNWTPKIGEVYMMSFTGSKNEQSGYRPGLIIQNNMGNMYSPNVIALPLTTSLKKLDQITHVLINSADTGLRKDSMVLCENPECMSKSKIGKYITTLQDNYMKKIAEAYILSTSIISYLQPEAYLMLMKKASDLNDIHII